MNSINQMITTEQASSTKSNNHNIKKLRKLVLFAAITACVLVTHRDSVNAQPVNELDEYGGWTQKTFPATGYFYPKHDGQRWWLVTPKGNAFISLGVNHYHAHWYLAKYNKEHWQGVFGNNTYEGLKKQVHKDFERLGFNTLGIHNDGALWDCGKPYVAVYEPLNISHYILDLSPEKYEDMFAPEFVTKCRNMALEVAGPRVNDPMLIGYQMADCPVFTDYEMAGLRKGYTFPLKLRNLGAGAPGKQAYVTEMKKRYKNNIGAFNSTYGTSFNSWDELASAQNWKTSISYSNQAELADNHAFNLICIDKYYSVAKTELLKVDPNHLFLGDKINGNTEQLERIVEVTTKYTDVVFYQIFGTWDVQKSVLDKAVARVKNQPFLNGDSSIGAENDHQSNVVGPKAPNRQTQAEWCKEVVEGTLSRPEFIGFHRCGIIDKWDGIGDGQPYNHQGVYDPFGNDHLLGNTYKDISLRLYEIASGK